MLRLGARASLDSSQPGSTPRLAGSQSSTNLGLSLQTRNESKKESDNDDRDDPNAPPPPLTAQRGDEDLLAAHDLYPYITQGHYYRKKFKVDLEKLVRDIPGLDIPVTIGPDGAPRPGIEKATMIESMFSGVTVEELQKIADGGEYTLKPIPKETLNNVLHMPQGPPLAVVRNLSHISLPSFLNSLLILDILTLFF